MNENNFSTRQVATTGHEIVNPDGEVIAWAIDEHWATIVVAVLNISLFQSATLK